MQDVDSFVERLRGWVDNPASDQEMELWHRRVYRGMPEKQSLEGLNLSRVERERAEGLGWISSDGSHVAQSGKLEPIKKVLPSASKPGKEGPKGTPVSKALTHSGKAEEKAALAAIDAVHGDGELPNIPLMKKALNPGTYAVLRHSAEGNPIEILHNSISWLGKVDHPIMSICHEVGHFLDLSGIGVKKKFSSIVGDPLLDDWKNAAHNSKRYKALIEKLNTTSDAFEREYYRYFSGDDELFARSYAQYIAQKSGGKKMAQEIERMRKSESRPEAVWDDDDFRQISDQFDVLFNKLGWRK